MLHHMLMLDPLPYAMDALEPYIDRYSLHLHWRYIYCGYLKTVNEHVPGLRNDPNVLLEVAEGADTNELYLAAAQAWNHAFFWRSMRPVNGTLGSPDGPLLEIARKQYGGLAVMRDEFIEKGLDQFGSGWVWVCLVGTDIVIETTPDADNPLLNGVQGRPLLVCDVWEHSYYPTHGPDREHYLSTWFDMVANFDFASENARAALRR